jgi:hypothetical protein
MNALNQIQALGLELIIIPPLFPSLDVDCVIGETFPSIAEHCDAFSEIQRFRGRVYVADSAIPASALDEKGRHSQDFDFENYHLCLRNLEGQIRGCFRLRLHPLGAAIRDLKLYDVIERMPRELADLSYGALAAVFELSSREGIRIGEVGGWAIDEKLRHHCAATLLPFAAWALYQVIGNAMVVASATTRHHSSAILKRMGGFALMYGGTKSPRFVDDFHGCELELLGFDSRRPHPKYEKLVAELKEVLLSKVRTDSSRQFDHKVPEVTANTNDAPNGQLSTAQLCESV